MLWTTICHLAMQNAKRTLSGHVMPLSLLNVVLGLSSPLAIQFSPMKLTPVPLPLCWHCHIIYPLLPSTVKTWVQRLGEKVNEIPVHIPCKGVEAKHYFQTGSFQVNSLCPALYHHFLFRLCYAPGEETVAKCKFFLHDFFSKFQNAFTGQFVGSRKENTLSIERSVLCIHRSPW